MRKGPITVMVSAVGKINDEGTTRTSLHTFKFESEQQLEEWLALAPKEKPDLFGPDIHVEIPR